MNECTANFFIYNGEILATSRFDLGFISRQHCIYEVMRVINGKPLFYKEHIERLAISARLERISSIPDEPLIRRNLKRLIDVNSTFTGNIKLIVYPDEKETTSLIAYWNPHWYPTDDDYKTGLGVMFYAKSRQNPNSKRLNVDFRKEVSEFIRDNGLYEAILLDEEGFITEGGRSNVFFIRNKKVFTTPTGLVLPGITRDKVFAICTELGIQLSETRLARNEAAHFDAMFITSTSSKVLPVRQLSEFNFCVTDSVLRIIMDRFNHIMEDDILEFNWNI